MVAIWSVIGVGLLAGSAFYWTTSEAQILSSPVPAIFASATPIPTTSSSVPLSKPQASTARPEAFSGVVFQNEGGEKKSFVAAQDEAVFRDKSGKERKITFQPVPTPADLQQRLEQEAMQQPDGRIFPIVYAAGAARNDVTRRLVTNEIRMEWSKAEDPIVPGAVSINRPDYAPGFVIIEMPDSFAALRAVEDLRVQAGAINPEVLLAKMRFKRALPNDPFLQRQWHLKFQNQPGAVSGTDINVEAAWAYGGTGGVRGAGVRVGVIDDGLETAHPDLAANVDTANDKDWNGNDFNPNPEEGDDHGTSCAGNVAAVAANGIGVAGSAPEAKLIGLRLIAGSVSDAQEAEAMAYLNNSTSGTNLIHLKSNSWGPDDSGTAVEEPGPLTIAAFQSAATSGRSGRGTIILWAAGNGGLLSDNSNYDGYANSIYTVAIGAFDSRSRRADYSEPGANVVVVAPSSGASPALEITTVDRSGGVGYNDGLTSAENPNADYTDTFGGTSSATPTAAGVVALMLQRNQLLGWRDVQEILIRSATRVNSGESAWAMNGAGIRFNHNYGAGLINATAAVTLAGTWTNLGAQTSVKSLASGLPLAIPENSGTGATRSFNLSSSNLRVEHVTLKLSLNHSARGNLEITLTSPSGMVSRLAEVREDPTANYGAWTFMSVRHWGETAVGNWTLKVADLSGTNNTAGGTLTSAELTVFGVQNPPPIVALTSPANNAVFSPAVPITLAASASDLTSTGATGIVSRVEFLSGATVIGTDTTAPYSVNWTAPSLGNYTLQARAIDSENAAGVSSAITISVANQPPVVTNASVTPASVAYSDQNLTATSVVASDPEGDAITLAYQWQQSLDGTAFTNVTGRTAVTLPAAPSNAGKLWRCRVTPNDGQQSGQSFASTSSLVVTRPQQTVASGQPYSYQADLPLASAQYRFGAGNQSPAGLAINPTTGLISGTVTAVPGTYSLVVERFTPQGTSISFTYSLQVTAAPIPLFSTWIQGYPGLSNITATGNSDGDNLQNLLEYAFGSDPSRPDGAQSVVISSMPDTLIVTYRLSKTTQQITDAVEWSTDLVTWSRIGVSFEANQDLGSHIQRTATIPRLARTKLFMRVVVGQN